MNTMDIRAGKKLIAVVVALLFAISLPNVVLAHDAAKRLFPYENPIGQTIWVGSEFYVVVGQTRPRMASAAIGGSFDARDYSLDAYIPLQTLRHRVGDLVMKRVGGEFQGEQVELSQITVSVDSVDDVDEINMKDGCW